MKSLLLTSLLLIAGTAQASFLCSSKEVNESGKPAWGMHVHESETSTHAHIAIWKTGQSSTADQFNCVRESSDYEGGRTSQYKCDPVQDKTLQVYTQITGSQIKASVDFRWSTDEVLLSNMTCKKD